MGITPAYAGKRKIIDSVQEITRDHPRLCGEKIYIMANDGFSAGITPAYAGKSTVLAERHNGIEDHPRLCGEKIN